MSSKKSSARDDIAGEHREVVARFLRLQAWLKSERVATAPLLSAELRVSQRTIKRDLFFLRERLGLRIVWDDEAKTYRLQPGGPELLPEIQLRPEQMRALVLAEMAARAWGGTAIGQALRSAVSNFARFIGAVKSLPDWEEAERVLTLGPALGGNGVAEQQRFGEILEASLERWEMEIDYRKPRPGAQAEPRVVQPLHQRFADGAWILVAYDCLRGQVQNFRLSRVQAARRTGRTFAPPENWDLKKYLEGAMGRFFGTARWEVRARVAPGLVPYLEDDPWNDSQEIATSPDGEGWFEVSWQAHSLEEARRKILAQGPEIEVLAPAELREQVITAIHEMSRRYGADAKARIHEA